jgi:carbon storage regulator CsrA
VLVLSRRESEKILFPSLGISVEVLKIQGGRARVGINAPADIPVLRHECAVKKLSIAGSPVRNHGVAFTPDLFQSNERLSELIHVMRKRLDAAATTLNCLNRSVEVNNEQDSQKFMSELYRELQSLESEANRVLENSGVPINSPTQALLVEDGEVERKLLEGYLEISGFDVVMAQDGLDALDYLSMHAQPDVILLDMMMPRLDGPAFVKEVRANPKLQGLSIFATSGRTQAEIEDDHGEVLVDRWFRKPFSPKDLVVEIAQYLIGKTLVAR